MHGVRLVIADPLVPCRPLARGAKVMNGYKGSWDENAMADTKSFLH